MTEVREGFHARDGWFFRREDDGSVHITAPDSMGPGASQVITLDADTWASVVASVAARGETADTFAKARRFHDGSEPAAAELDPAQFARQAYAAYGEATGGKNHRGEPMPAWEDLGDTIRGAWTAATTAVIDRVTSPEGP